MKLIKRVAKAGFTRVENFIKAMDINTDDTEELKIRLDKLETLRKLLEENLMELNDKEVTEAQVE